MRDEDYYQHTNSCYIKKVEDKNDQSTIKGKENSLKIREKKLDRLEKKLYEREQAVHDREKKIKFIESSLRDLNIDIDKLYKEKISNE